MNPQDTPLSQQLAYLKLLYVVEHYAALASEAAQQQWPPVDYLARLIDGEAQRRQQQSLERRIAAARFPALKTLEQFNWSWPKKINRPQVQQLFHLAFLNDHTNVILVGGVKPPTYCSSGRCGS